MTHPVSCLASSPPGEPCPVNGRSPGSVSTQHSSPRSDAASASGPPAVPIPTATSPPEGSALQTSDVVIHRKENEGFGFVIISSLNRPENATVISELLLSGGLEVVTERKLTKDPKGGDCLRVIVLRVFVTITS